MQCSKSYVGFFLFYLLMLCSFKSCPFPIPLTLGIEVEPAKAEWALLLTASDSLMGKLKQFPFTQYLLLHQAVFSTLYAN